MTETAKFYIETDNPQILLPTAQKLTERKSHRKCRVRIRAGKTTG